MLAAVLFVLVLAGMSVFQIALVCGAPLGRFTWGGQYPGALPAGMRAVAGASVLVYVLMGALALDRAGAVALFPDGTSQVGMWFVFGFLIINTVPNALSRSRAERLVMTQVLIVLSVLALIVALA